LIKIAGLAGMILSSTLLGMLKAEQLKERIRLLEDFAQMMLELKSRMNYFRQPLLQIFDCGRKTAPTAAFRLAEESMCQLREKQGEIGQIWAQKVEEIYGSTPLTPKDRAILAEPGTFIGQTDLENQDMKFSWVEKQLHLQLAEARNIYGQKGPMYRRLGLFAGVLAALILL